MHDPSRTVGAPDKVAITCKQLYFHHGPASRGGGLGRAEDSIHIVSGWMCDLDYASTAPGGNRDPRQGPPCSCTSATSLAVGEGHTRARRGPSRPEPSSTRPKGSPGPRRAPSRLERLLLAHSAVGPGPRQLESGRRRTFNSPNATDRQRDIHLPGT